MSTRPCTECAVNKAFRAAVEAKGWRLSSSPRCSVCHGTNRQRETSQTMRKSKKYLSGIEWIEEDQQKDHAARLISEGDDQ